MIVTFPCLYSINESIVKNSVRQIRTRSFQREGSVSSFAQGTIRGIQFQPDGGGESVLIIPKVKQFPEQFSKIVEGSVNGHFESLDFSASYWLKHPIFPRLPIATDFDSIIKSVQKSWINAFSYIQEDAEQDVIGLRGPQIGALHAVHAHWAVSDAPATIVMPTGTGKTDTMLSILVACKCPKLLVVVPTDALRVQLTEKFLTLGILKSSKCSILHPEADFPIVCTLKHIPKTEAEVDSIFRNSQVIVTTSIVAGQCSASIQTRMAEHCQYLFIDEAHHAEAPTWKRFKEIFSARRILQFTATPFREDGKPLDGKIIFNYPLRKAQQEGYFKTIRFLPVIEFYKKRSDEAIAKKAVEQLRADFSKGHILMARVESVARAKEVFKLYEPYQEFSPVQIHTGVPANQRESIRKKMISGESRIIVCVDMLGEGFDLPSLKIAAFHDIRKSLAVTLQLAGRFTRSLPNLGDATFIANTADVNVRDELRKLYARDPDWNLLLPQFSDLMIGEQVSLQEFIKGFSEFAENFPLETVRPATSTVVYKTTCADWSPENFRKGISGIDACDQIHFTINPEKRVIIIVTARRLPLPWSDVEKFHDWEWELHIVFWSEEQNLLYINGSSNSGDYKLLAQAVAGETAKIVSGQNVFRVFSGVNRLRLQNVGLTEQLGRNVRYTGRMGADVESALSELQKNRSQKSVLSGSGFEGGERTTVGASNKGRIWSHQRGRIDQLVDWCKIVGTKLLDEAIRPDEVLKGTLEVSIIAERPLKMPIGIDWPDKIYREPEHLWSISLGDVKLSLVELSLELVSPKLAGNIRFAIKSDSAQSVLELQLYVDDEIPEYRISLIGEEHIKIHRGERSEAVSLTEFFNRSPPTIWFADGSAITGNEYVELKASYPPYDPAKIQTWDWNGINLRKESQGAQKEQDTIQARVIQELKFRNRYHLIFDDDGSGESADVVAIQLVGDSNSPSRIDVEFYHCKYSQEQSPGGRIGDLYEVCGQAQKSIAWMYSFEKKTDLFTHLLHRESLRQDSGRSSRIEFGNEDLLQSIREMSRICGIALKVFIVQPGVSKASVTLDQLQLLSVTENYLMETYQIGFSAIASA